MDVVNYLVDEGAVVNIQDNKGVGYVTTTIPMTVDGIVYW